MNISTTKKRDSTMSDKPHTSITIILPAGRLPVDLMKKITEISEQYDISIYLSTLQNLRLINVPVDREKQIREELSVFNVQFKGAGQFPVPRICIGKPHCNLGVIDTEELSSVILARYGNRSKTKAKLKIAIAGCILSCSGSKTSDIGIVAGRNGFDLFAGGKGGSSPKAGRRIKRSIDEAELLETIDNLVAFHDEKTEKKQRMFKLLADPEFPYPEA